VQEFITTYTCRQCNLQFLLH